MKKNTPVLPEHDLPQVILLGGNDYIGREKMKAKFLAALRTQHPDLTEEGFDSSREPFELFIERIITPSLFQSARVFHLRHAQEYKDDEMQRLSAILSAEFADVYVCIEYEPKGGKKKVTQTVIDKLDFKTKAKKNPRKFLMLTFEKPPDYKLAEWLCEQTPALFGRRMTKEAAAYLLERAGSELDLLYSELEKLDIDLPEKAPLDKTAVERIIGDSRPMTPFELAEALGRRNIHRAVAIVESLYRHGFSAPAAVSAIFRHFRHVFKIRAFADEHRDVINAYARAQYAHQMTIAHEIGVHTGILNKTDPVKKAYPVMILSGIIEQARVFGFDHLKTIFTWLREFDVGIKTGHVKPTQQAFTLLCYRIIRVAELSAERPAV